MKRGTIYAKRVKRIYAQVKKQGEEPRIGDPTDPMEQLLLAALSQETSLGNARKALDKLLDSMVDLNEMRVSLPREIAAIADEHIPNSRVCASRFCTLLNSVFDRHNVLNLHLLHSMGKRDAKHWLEELNGIEPYHVASVMLWSLGGHAIPVNNLLLSALRKDDLVEPKASVSEVQSFLERHISPAEAKEFCLRMEGFSPRKSASGPKAAPSAQKTGDSEITCCEKADQED
ncbi:MAG: hypothetical protein KAV00_09005 [Phycisphaerae bacterium]|nr:hypothetical protein [Phycisphaerae bacterium]